MSLLFTHSYAGENDDFLGTLAMAKVTGACGIMNEMIDFQSKTKMAGGDEFVARFWATEAARRGMSVEQINKQCNDSIVAYDKMWKMMEKGK